MSTYSCIVRLKKCQISMLQDGTYEGIAKFIPLNSQLLLRHTSPLDMQGHTTAQICFLWACVVCNYTYTHYTHVYMCMYINYVQSHLYVLNHAHIHPHSHTHTHAHTHTCTHTRTHTHTHAHTHTHTHSHTYTHTQLCTHIHTCTHTHTHTHTHTETHGHTHTPDCSGPSGDWVVTGIIPSSQLGHPREKDSLPRHVQLTLGE